MTVLNETLYYRVDQILTVLPNETDALAIEKGKDYVTLVTCTPMVSTHIGCLCWARESTTRPKTAPQQRRQRQNSRHG